MQYNKTGFYHSHTLRVYGHHIHKPYDSPQCKFPLCNVTCFTQLLYTVATELPLSTSPSYKMYTGETLTKAHRYTLSDILSHIPSTDKMCSDNCQEDARQGTNKSATSLLGSVNVPELYRRSQCSLHEAQFLKM